MNIYFSGIGGVGIGPLAEIAHDAGYQIVGSDLEESLLTNKLIAEGVEISFNQDGKFLEDYHQKHQIDWFVYTAALDKNHTELNLAKKLGIKTSKRDELLAHIIKEKNLKLIAISGTHGKTTTTAMLVWTMMRLNIPISYSIGTTLSFGPSGKFDPKSEYFVYECDEFDRNFLNFHPYLSLIPSVDFDHSDTYKNEQEYLQAFHDFIAQSQHTIIWDDQHSEYFDELDGVTVLSSQNLSKSITVYGEQNRRNASLVIEALKQLELSQTATDIINNFPGVDRRFEKLADNLYSDYGHHPTEIAATLQHARELSDHVVLVYQPHQNIRQHELIDKYTNQFELADKIYWLPTYLSREDPNLKILTPNDLIQNITNRDKVEVADFDDNLWQDIQKAIKNNNLVLCMGAGAIDGWVRKQLAKD